MSLYIFLATAVAIGVFLRFRYGAQVIPYVAAALLLILFLYCPSRFQDGFQGWTAAKPTTLEDKVDQLGEVVSFGLLILAAWLAGGSRRSA